MSLPIVFKRIARKEFDEAADWYEERRTGLGAKFTSAMQRTLGRHIARLKKSGWGKSEVRRQLILLENQFRKQDLRRQKLVDFASVSRIASESFVRLEL